jgi:hypothetical protein
VSDAHLKELRTPLEQNGWRVLLEKEGDDYRISGLWCIQRSTRVEPTEILFQSLDDMRTLPVERAYACAVKNHEEVGLYFGSMAEFRKALPAFVRALDGLQVNEPKNV